MRYETDELEGALKLAPERNTDDLFISKTRDQDDSFKFALFITDSNQHYEVKQIMQKNWSVL